MITILRNRYTKGSARERLPQDAVEYGLSLQGVLGYDSLCQGGEGDKTGAGAAALETSSGHAQMELHDLATESSQGQVINLFPGADLRARRWMAPMPPGAMPRTF